MKNIFLSVVVVATLIAAGVGGTFAGFVDTEESIGNRYQAGHLDLLINDANDPDVGSKLTVICGIPSKSYDVFIKAENRGECLGAELFMHFKNPMSVEAGDKLGEVYFADGTYATGTPGGAGVATSEPELIAEEGGGYFGQQWIGPNDPSLTWQENANLEQGLGTDYASGVAAHLDVLVQVCDDEPDGWLDNPDDNGDGIITATEAANHNWVPIDSLTGKLVDIECEKNALGYMESQDITFIWLRVHLQQLYDLDWPGDPQLDIWPTNALQGDLATWDMLFELIMLDPPPEILP